MQARILVEFGVEGDAELTLLTCGDDAPVDVREHLDVGSGLDDARRADKRERYVALL